MSAPETEVIDRVIAVATAAFGNDLPTAVPDKLLRASGKDGARLAVYTEAAIPNPRRRIELVVPAVLQVYLTFDPKPDENLVVDPRVIAELAERFRQALKTRQGATNASNWFLRLQAVRYPDDPTGNKSRFEAAIEAVGENTVEFIR